MNISTRLEGDLKLIAATAKRAAALDREVGALVVFWGQMLNTRIKANASGRPGPNAPTGNYRRSWNVEVSRRGGTTSSTNGTNMPQGRRLEYGFVGPDSLGRVYNQPPYPHVGPALDAIRPEFIRAHEALVRGIAR